MTEEYLDYFKQRCSELQEKAKSEQQSLHSHEHKTEVEADSKFQSIETPSNLDAIIKQFINQYIMPEKYNEFKYFSDEEVKILQTIVKDELSYDITEEKLTEFLYLLATKMFYESFEKKFMADNPNLDNNFSAWINAYINTFDSNYNFADFLSIKIDELQIEFPVLDLQEIEDFYVQIKNSNFRLYYELLDAVQMLEDINIAIGYDEVLEYEDLKIIYYLSQQKIDRWMQVYCIIGIEKEIKQRLLQKKVQQHKENMAGGGKINKNKVEILHIDSMDGISFENFLMFLFEKMNYKAEVTQASNDQGADLVIEKLGERTVVQAKCYTSTVGNSAVQEVVTAKQYYNCSKAMVITNNYFTKSAVELAMANQVELKDRDDLTKWLELYPVYVEEITAEVYP